MNYDLPPSLRKFEGELERAIKRQLELAPPTRHSWRARPRLLAAATSLGLVAIATALALVLTAASSSPAYAVTRNHDGTVLVKIIRLSGLRPANERLAAMKLRVRFVQVLAPAGCPSRQPPLPPPPGPGRRPWHALQYQVKPGRIPPGRTLVIEVHKASRTAHVVTAHAVRVPAQSAPRALRACMPLIPPPPCHWRVGRFKYLPPPHAPVPFPPNSPLPRGRTAMPQVPIPSCKAALSPVPAPGR